MSSGSATSATCAASVAALAGQPDAPAARACRRSPGGRTRPRRGGRPSARRASGRARPAARRARSARPSGGTAGRCARPRLEEALAGLDALADQARRARVSVGVMPPRPTRPGTSASQCRNASTPSPVRALTSMRWTPGCTASRFAEQAVDVEVEVRQQVDLVDQDELAGAEHQRVLQRLVLALGDRADHDPRVLADAELRRADEVADVLDDQQVDVAERQRPGSPSGPCSRPGGTRRRSPCSVLSCVTGTWRSDEPVGVEAALHVALEHARAHARRARPARAPAAASCPRRARSSG